jgi:hypothetical protein
VGPVELDTVEPGLLAPHRGGHEVLDELLDLGRGHRPCIDVAVGAGGDRRFADEFGRGPSPGVVELDDGQAAGGFDAVCQPGEPGEMLVTEATELTGKPLADPLHMAGARHGEAEAALGSVGEPPELLVTEGAVEMALLVGQGRQHEPVGHRRTMGEADGVEW